MKKFLPGFCILVTVLTGIVAGVHYYNGDIQRATFWVVLVVVNMMMDRDMNEDDDA